MAKGYNQNVGIDYDDVFSPVAYFETITMIISFVAWNKWPIYQLDIGIS